MEIAKDNHPDRLADTTQFLSRSAQRASIYLCYAPADESAARRFCDAVEARGTPCWFGARDIKPKMAWPQCLVEAIESCRFFVFLLTENARASHDLVAEIADALRVGRTIIVLQSVDTIHNPELEELLSESHIIDVDDPLVGRDIDYAWAKIVEIESDQTWDHDPLSSSGVETRVRSTAKSFLLQMDCPRGKVYGKISCQIAIGDRLILGRSPEADIFVDDQRASRRHAGLFLERDSKYGLELHIMDLMSRNGTWVRYRRDGDTDISKFLEHSKTRIQSGAIIRIGSTDIRITAIPIPTSVVPVGS